MTVRILKSTIAGIADFPAQAATFAVEMKNWRAHMARVKEDEGKPDLPPIERHWAHPRPSAHPLVERAVNENCEADFEIVDDGPTPDQVLEGKKNDLLNRVSVNEQVALASIVPIARRRSFEIRENDIRNSDSKMAADLTPGLLKKAAVALGAAQPIDVAAEVAKRRPAADTKHLEEQDDRRRRCDVIIRASSQAMADIDGLTLETIDGWKIPDFKGLKDAQ